MMGLRYTTKSGAVWEVDTVNRQARRRGGPPGRTRTTDAWRDYHEHWVDAGVAVFDWGESEAGKGRYTTTSTIVSTEVV